MTTPRDPTGGASEGAGEHQDDGWPAAEVSAEDAELLARLGEAMAPPPAEPPQARVAALRALAQQAAEQAQQAAPPTRPDGGGGDTGAPPLTVVAPDSGARRPARRDLILSGAAAAIGAVLGVAGGRASADGSRASDDPPTEPIRFDGVPAGTSADARLINHTWGVELLLDVADLSPGAVYDVRYLARSGDEVAAGSFVAVPDVLMVCRFNAALLRQDTAAIEVRGRDDGVRMTARLA